MNRRISFLFGLSGVFFCGLMALAEEPAKPASKDAGVAAYIDDKPVTTAELDEKILKTNMKLAQQLFDARKAAVDQVVLDRAFAKEAAEKKVSVDEIVKAKVAEKAKPVTDDEIKAYFDANQARMQGKTIEQMSGQIKNFLAGQREGDARNNLLAEARKNAKVRMVIDAPRVEVAIAANDPSEGAKDAKVTVVEFSDFQCPFCSRGAATIKQVHEAYGDKVRIVFRHFPLAMHNRATPAAEAADCANEQGKFWEYHDKLFGNQQAMTDDDFTKHATDLGLDVAKFKECFSAGKFKADVQKDMADGSKYGVTGTPAFFVNGRFVSGAQPFESFKAMIDEELAK